MNPANLNPASKWRAIALAGRFVLPIGSSSSDNDSSWHYAGRWLVLWGLLIGLLYAGIFGAAWRFYGEHHGIRFAPVIVVLAVDFAFGGYRRIWAFAHLIQDWLARAPTRPMTIGPAAITAVVAIVLLKYGLLVAMPRGAWNYPWNIFNHLGWFYPSAAYRPYVLMPIWGCWATMLALTLGRISTKESGRMVAIAHGHRLFITVAHWLICTLLTVIYASAEPRHVARGLIISLVVLVAAYLAAFTFARRFRGQTEETVQATGLVAELVLLGAYLPAANVIYGY